MRKEADIKEHTAKVNKKFTLRLLLYYLFLFLFFIGLLFVVRFAFHGLNILLLSLFIILVVIIGVEIIKVFKVKKVLDVVKDLIDRGLFHYAYYLISYLEEAYSYESISDIKDKLSELIDTADLYFQTKNYDQLYDAELDKIIDLINFNIDIYEGFYVQNRIAFENSKQQIDEFLQNDPKLKEYLGKEKEILSLEEERLAAFSQIKNYFEKMKKEQIRLMLTLPDIDIMSKDYGRFVNNLLDKAYYTAEAQEMLARIDKAKDIFYEIFPAILKAETREEIKEKLKRLESI